MQRETNSNRLSVWSKAFISTFGVYIMWITLHYMSSHFYIHLCVPASILGFLTSPLLATSYHCQGLWWLVNQGRNSIHAMWLILGSWITTNYLFPISPVKD